MMTEAALRRRLGPAPEHLLGGNLGATVVVERVERRALVHLALGEAVDSDRARKDDPLDAKLLGNRAGVLGAVHVHLLIALARADVVPVLGGEVVEEIAAAAGLERAARSRTSALTASFGNRSAGSMSMIRTA